MIPQTISFCPNLATIIIDYFGCILSLCKCNVYIIYNLLLLFNIMFMRFVHMVVCKYSLLFALLSALVFQ